MQGDEQKNVISERFNSINWHDSKLIEMHINYIADHHCNDIHLKIRLLINPNPGNYEWVNGTVILRNCTIVRMNLDLTAKLICSDDISMAFCERETLLKKQIEMDELRNEDTPLADYFHFHFSLVPPGGEIDVFAKDFDLKKEGSPEGGSR